MRALICGGRGYRDYNRLAYELHAWQIEHGRITVVINGGAIGADTLAERWGEYHALPVITMKAPWTRHKSAAGPIRNGWMLKHASPDVVLAFPGGKGTEDMKRQARDKGLRVYQLGDGDDPRGGG